MNQVGDILVDEHVREREHVECIRPHAMLIKFESAFSSCQSQFNFGFQGDDEQKLLWSSGIQGMDDKRSTKFSKVFLVHRQRCDQAGLPLLEQLEPLKPLEPSSRAR